MQFRTFQEKNCGKRSGQGLAMTMQALFRGTFTHSSNKNDEMPTARQTMF